MLGRVYFRGDTIIEVLFAMAVFSMVAVGGLAIMNSGTATAQRALEITQVRQQIDAQAETLKFIHHSYVAAFEPGKADYTGPAAQWPLVVAKADALATSFGAVAGSCPSVPADAFIMNARRAELATGASGRPLSMADAASTRPYAQVIYHDDNVDTAAGSSTVIDAVEGIWIEAVTTSSETEKRLNRSGYIDFHIRACWNGPGDSAPLSLGTIVRLYDPYG